MQNDRADYSGRIRETGIEPPWHCLETNLAMNLRITIDIGACAGQEDLPCLKKVEES
jgi:hypothetical protein